MIRKEIVEALEIVKPGLADKEIVTQSTFFAFKDGRVVTYNDSISVSHPVAGIDFDGAVRAEEFYKFLSKITKSEIELIKEKNELLIKAGRGKAGLALTPEIVLPLKELGNIGKWKKIPAGFIDALELCLGSTSKDMSKKFITCIHISTDGKIQSTDDYRISQYKIDSMPLDSFLLPGSAAEELVRYNVIRIAETKGWRHFRTREGTIFSCRIEIGKYPDIERILEMDGEEIALPGTLGNALERAAVFGKREHKSEDLVSIELEKGKLILKSANVAGWSEEVLKSSYREKKISFMINPAYLKMMIEKMDSCIVGSNAIKFRGENWSHLICVSR